MQRVGLWSVLEARGGLEAGGPDNANGTLGLSKGEEQVFCLARAILRKRAMGKSGERSCGLLLLDEATSNTDAATDQRLQAVLREEFVGWTVMSVAHRLETVADADVVVRLEKGRLAEVGTPAEVLHVGVSEESE